VFNKSSAGYFKTNSFSLWTSFPELKWRRTALSPGTAPSVIGMQVKIIDIARYIIVQIK
jgi:hypothetical protein